jgi:uncharacterized membrane-anchored protein
MIPLEEAHRIELNRLLTSMTPENVEFLRLVTARLVRALGKQEPILVMFPEMKQEEIEIYTRGMDAADVYSVLVEAAEVLMESQATAPSPSTTQ